MSWWKKTALVLANIGAINWAFAQWNWNLIEKLITPWAGDMVTTIIYYLVALCGLYALVLVFKD